jgi:hypothetical protein
MGNMRMIVNIVWEAQLRSSKAPFFRKKVLANAVLRYASRIGGRERPLILDSDFQGQTVAPV